MSYNFRPIVHQCNECGADTELTIVTVHDPEVGITEELPICMHCLEQAFREQIEEHAQDHPDQFESFKYEDIKTGELLTDDYASLAINFRHATCRIMRTPIFNTYGALGIGYTVVISSLLNNVETVGIIHPLDCRSIASVVDTAMVYMRRFFIDNKYPEVLLP